jgi:hypothetical protein
MYNPAKYLLTMQPAFEQLIRQLMNPASAETQNAMRMLNTNNPNDIPTVITMRMNREPLFFNSMLYDNFQVNERAFAAANVPGMNTDLWVNFVTQVRTFVRQQQQPQQQQQYMQQREAEPVLGPVPPMPPGINRATAARIEQDINRQLGGKKSRSKQRGRKSIHRRKKSMHKKRK